MFLGTALVAGAVGVGVVTLEKSASANAPLAVPPADPPLNRAALPELVARSAAGDPADLIAVPSTWANHGRIIAAFEAEYGIEVDVQSPNATSAQGNSPRSD